MTRTITNILGISAAAAALVAGSWGLAGPAMAATAVGHLGHFTVDGARIRVDRFDPWGPVAGLGQRRDHVTIWCKDPGPSVPGGELIWWFNLTDDTTGVRGWSSTTVAASVEPLDTIGRCTGPAATPPTASTPAIR